MEWASGERTLRDGGPMGLGRGWGARLYLQQSLCPVFLNLLCLMVTQYDVTHQWTGSRWSCDQSKGVIVPIYRWNQEPRSHQLPSQASQTAPGLNSPCVCGISDNGDVFCRGQGRGTLSSCL